MERKSPHIWFLLSFSPLRPSRRQFPRVMPLSKPGEQWLLMCNKRISKVVIYSWYLGYFVVNSAPLSTVWFSLPHIHLFISSFLQCRPQSSALWLAPPQDRVTPNMTSWSSLRSVSWRLTESESVFPLWRHKARHTVDQMHFFPPVSAVDVKIISVK